MGCPLRVALFGDARTVPYVRDLLALDPGLGVSCFSAALPLAGALALRKADVAHGVMAISMWKIFRRAKRAGALTVNHWIGSDVLQTLGSPALQEALERSRPWIDLHLSVAPWLGRELAELGIEARQLPIVPADLAVRQTFVPEGHAVLAYATAGREHFYGVPAVAELARRFPEVPFTLCGGALAPPDGPKNLLATGALDAAGTERLYGRSTILVRLAQHDGLSKMVLEALAHGRRVIWNHEMEGVRRADGVDQAAVALEELLSEPPRFDREAAQAVVRRFAPPLWAARARALYEERLDRSGGQG